MYTGRGGLPDMSVTTGWDGGGGGGGVLVSVTGVSRFKSKSTSTSGCEGIERSSVFLDLGVGV